MIEFIKYPALSSQQELLKRAVLKEQDLETVVAEIFDAVATSGDAAILDFNRKFGAEAQESLTDFKPSGRLDEELKRAIDLAAKNIELFHRSQIQNPEVVETMQGVSCWRENRGIEQVGIYIPGGTAPLFSTVLMLGVPAKLAGCKEIVLVTPPDQQGNIHPAVLYAAELVGVTRVVAAGGIQAIAGLTFGTASIPRVSKIFGPGNQYVTAAKSFAQKFGVAIDMPAGPSEVMLIADKSANPEYLAADMLSQMEHGADSQAILLTVNEKVAQRVLEELEMQTRQLNRSEVVMQSANQSRVILLDSLEECFRWSNVYAPEHLILAVEGAETWLEMVINAGSVFLGNYSCESFGDYASGTNHTLPTNGYARMYSGVSLDSFVKKITVQRISAEGVRNLGPAVEIMAASEGLDAHKNAVSVRLKDVQ